MTTVRELIEELENYPDELRVAISDPEMGARDIESTHTDPLIDDHGLVVIIDGGKAILL